MKMINAGNAGILDYPVYSRNCNLNKCQRPYLVPIPTFRDLQLFVNFGPNKPDTVTFTMVNLCSNITAEITTDCFKIAYNGSYWYGIFRKFEIDFAFPTFLIVLQVVYENTNETTFFSEQYTMANECVTLTPVSVCYPVNYNAEDPNGIYVGQHDTTQPYSGKENMIYQHIYWVRNSETIETTNKMTFVSNKRRNFATTFNKIKEFRLELVPGWYKDYLAAVYFRGDFLIDSKQVRANDLGFENILEDADLWKATVKIEEEVKGFFGCSTIECPPDECVCFPPTLPDYALPDALQYNPYYYVINLGGTGPFEISGATLPAWMNADIVGSTVVFSGTPDDGDVENDINIFLIVSNGCGAVEIENTIDVADSEGGFPFTIVLQRLDDNHLRAHFYGGTPPYDYAFGAIMGGSACAAYSFTPPNGTTSASFVDVAYTADPYQNATYLFYCDGVDSLGANATSNNVAEPGCLVPETMILMNDKKQKALNNLKEGDLLAGNNVITSFQRIKVETLYNINNGLLKTSPGHIHVMHDGSLKKSISLVKGDILTSQYGAPITVDEILVVNGHFEVINISTDNKTYIANGVLTHNKLPC